MIRLRRRPWPFHPSLILLVTTAAVVLASCSPTAPDADESGGQAQSEVVVLQPDDPPNMDPQTPGGPFGGNITFNIFDSLTWTTPDMSETQPQLATEWRNVDDTTWQFDLREGVTFHNGEPFNAEAVKFTVERMLDPNPAVERALYSFGILDSVEIVDDYTVNIHTNEPDPILPARLAGLSIIPPGYASDLPEEDFARDPVGAGPYQLAEFEPGQQLVLESFDDYWNGEPTVDRLVFRPVPEASTRVAELRSGRADIILQQPIGQVGAVQNEANLRVESILGKRVPFIGLDLLPGGPEALTDRQVRQALNYAVDVELIIETVLEGNGQQIATMFRPDFVGYDENLEPYPYDPERARELLDQAGYPDGFSLTMHSSESIFPAGNQVAQAIAAQLSEVGIDVTVEPVGLSTLRNTIIGGQEADQNNDMWTWNWGAREPDPDSPLSGFLHSEGVSSFYSNPELDDLIDQARSEMDQTKREAMYGQIQQLIYDEAPIIFLYVAQDLYGVSDRIN